MYETKYSYHVTLHFNIAFQFLNWLNWDKKVKDAKNYSLLIYFTDSFIVSQFMKFMGTFLYLSNYGSPTGQHMQFNGAICRSYKKQDPCWKFKEGVYLFSASITSYNAFPDDTE